MTTKRELLEACAKATGKKITVDWLGHPDYVPDWNPIDNSGDGADMEAEMRVNVFWEDSATVRQVVSCYIGGETFTEAYANHTDPQAARRWASCRAVAATVEKPRD